MKLIEATLNILLFDESEQKLQIVICMLSKILKRWELPWKLVFGAPVDSPNRTIGESGYVRHLSKQLLEGNCTRTSSTTTVTSIEWAMFLAMTMSRISEAPGSLKWSIPRRRSADTKQITSSLVASIHNLPWWQGSVLQRAHRVEEENDLGDSNVIWESESVYRGGPDEIRRRIQWHHHTQLWKSSVYNAVKNHRRSMQLCWTF